MFLYVYVFKADHMGLDNVSGGSPLEKADSFSEMVAFKQQLMLGGSAENQNRKE